MFEGHKMYKIGSEWVFDLTEFIGYKVKVEDGIVLDYKEAYIVYYDKDSNTYEFKKFMDVPLGVLRKTRNIIEYYFKEALIWRE